MASTSKGLEAALCQCRHALRSTKTAQLRESRRAFSTTLTRQGRSVPAFYESDNAPLNDLFADIRAKIFVPAYLKAPQKRLLVKQKYRNTLLNEPFMVDLGDETFQLLPLDPFKDVPNSWKSTKAAIELMGEDPDLWANLNALLEGMHNSGRRWSEPQWTWILRQTAAKGMVQHLVRACYESHNTGLVLNDTRYARLALWACVQKAMQGHWDHDSLQTARRSAMQLAELLDTDKHCGQKNQRTRDLFAVYGDPRKQPDIIGVLLLLSAERAVRFHDGVDVDGEVAVQLKRLLPNLGHEPPHASFTNAPAKFASAEADYQLARWVPVLQGLRLADKILGASLPEGAAVQQHVRELEHKTAAWRQQVDESMTLPLPRFGMELYDAVQA